MSHPRTPPPAMLFLSVLSSSLEALWPALQEGLEARFGPLAYCSEPLAFTETRYYDAELGTPISRRVLGFERLIEQSGLAEAKLATNALEAQFSRPDGRRRVNLDPGLLCLERLVLASGKPFAHRIYLERGIWADLTLIFRSKGWRALPWTYPDYAGTILQRHLLAMRSITKQKIT